MHSQAKSVIALLVCAFIWGTAFVGQKTGMDNIGPFYFVAFRNAIGALALLPIYFVSKKIMVPKSAPAIASKDVLASADKELPANAGKDEASAVFPAMAPAGAAQYDPFRQALKGGFFCSIFLFLASVAQQAGLIYTTAGKSAFITTLYIILVPIIAIFLRHKTTFRVWIGAVLAVLGLYFLCLSGEGQGALNRGDIFTIVGSFFWAGHILTMDKFAPHANVSLLVLFQSIFSALWAFPAGLIFEEISMDGFMAALPALLYVGILSTGIAYTLQGLGQKNCDPTLASIIMSLESVFAVIAGLVMLHEIMNGREVTGCVLMFAAIIIAQLPDKKEKAPVSE